MFDGNKVDDSSVSQDKQVSEPKSIAVEEYETRLAKTILDTRPLFESLFLKITQALKQALDLLEKNDRKDGLRIFSLMSRLQNNFPEIKKIDDLLKPNFNIHAMIEFYKLIFEDEVISAKIKANIVPQMLTLAQIVQNKIAQDPTLSQKLTQHLRPDALFSDRNRGRVKISNKPTKTRKDFKDEDSNESDDDEEDASPATRKFGIMSETETPKEFQNYFSQDVEAAQLQFDKNPDSPVVQRMDQHNLPYISGPSGTLGFVLPNIMKLMPLSPQDMKMLFTVYAANFVAQGHHSFYEVMVVFEKLGFPVTMDGDKKSFYEQLLPQAICESQEYINFKKKFMLLDNVKSNQNRF